MEEGMIVRDWHRLTRRYMHRFAAHRLLFCFRREMWSQKKYLKPLKTETEKIEKKRENCSGNREN
jgi:hypothetical protein